MLERIVRAIVARAAHSLALERVYLFGSRTWVDFGQVPSDLRESILAQGRPIQDFTPAARPGPRG
jgi:hypothetical protein